MGNQTVESTWERVIDLARFAPSPHNTQPWKVRPIDERRAELFVQRRRTLPDEDTTGCFIVCAMGIFIEAVSIVAAELGWDLRVEPLEGREREGLVPFALLALEPREKREKAAFTSRLVFRRQTSRLEPLAKLVPDDALERLATVASAGGQRFSHTADARLTPRILDRNVEAVFMDLNNPRYHDEIVTWFRYGERHAGHTNDGLDARCMNTPAHELYLSAKMPWLMSSPISKPLMRALYHRRLGAARQIGFLSGPFFQDPVRGDDGTEQMFTAGRTVPLAAGRCLLRLWLAMTKCGISIHPFGNLVTNAGAHRWLTEAVGIERIWLVFRFGYTRLPPRSKRLPAREILC